MSSLASTSFDVYVNERHVGVLSEAGKATVFTYLPDVPPECLVSLLMPVRAESYKWSAGFLPYFQMNLPEGYKYKGTLEDLEKLSRTYIPSLAWQENARRLYLLLLLLVNYALRNADAHLKNFAVTYGSPKDVSLAPVYDIVTVSAYSRFESRIPALALAGKRVWAAGKLLNAYASGRLGLSVAERERCVKSTIAAVKAVAPRVGAYAERFPEFREIAKNMLDAWAMGIEGIKPTARPGKYAAEPLRQQAGLSTPVGRKVKLKTSL